MEAMAQEIKQLKMKLSEPKEVQGANIQSTTSKVVCQFRGAGDHTISCCQLFASQDESKEENVSYMNNYNRGPRNDPYSNTYNPGWRNHPNFSYSNNQPNQQGPPGFQPKSGYHQGQPSQPPKPSWEAAVESIVNSVKQLADEVKSQGKSIKILEQQMAQMAAGSSRPPGQLPGQPEMNPKETCRAVALRSGKELQGPEAPPPTMEEEEKEPAYVPPPPYKPPLFFQKGRSRHQRTTHWANS